ncbi:hypothetical protein JCM18918_28 [Cutibacterium acnes JCM 18918]|nr:hypothetical protein JCM18918_28 [Cutibacterium acnes JCM 18918]
MNTVIGDSRAYVMVYPDNTQPRHSTAVTDSLPMVISTITATRIRPTSWSAGFAESPWFLLATS